MAALLLVNSGRTHHLVPQVTSALVVLWVAVRIEYAARLFLIETAGGRMAGIARNIELYSLAYRLALKQIFQASEALAAEYSFTSPCFYPAPA